MKPGTQIRNRSEAIGWIYSLFSRLREIPLRLILDDIIERNFKFILSLIVFMFVFAYIIFNNPYIPKVYMLNFNMLPKEMSYAEIDSGYGFSQGQTIRMTRGQTFYKELLSDQFNIAVKEPGNSHFFSGYYLSHRGWFFKKTKSTGGINRTSYGRIPFVFQIPKSKLTKIVIKGNKNNEELIINGNLNKTVYGLIFFTPKRSVLATTDQLFAVNPKTSDAEKIISIRTLTAQRNVPYLLLVKGLSFRISNGDLGVSWLQFHVNLSSLGRFAKNHTIPGLILSFCVASLFYTVIRQPLFSIKEDHSFFFCKDHLLVSLCSIVSLVYGYLFYLYFPGVGPVDFPYEQVLQGRIKMWLSIYNTIFYYMCRFAGGYYVIHIIRIILTLLVIFYLFKAVQVISGRPIPIILWLIVLLFALNPVVVAYSFYFKRDVIGCLLIALSFLITIINYTEKGRIPFISYILILVASLSRIDYIFYLFGMLLVGPLSMKGIVKRFCCLVILICVVMVMHMHVPKYFNNDVGKINNYYKIVSLQNFIQYVLRESPQLFTGEDKQLFLKYYKSLDGRQHANHYLPTAPSNRKLRSLWVKLAYKDPHLFMKYLYSQLNMAFFRVGWHAAATYHPSWVSRALNAHVLNSHAGSFPYMMIARYLFYNKFWNLCIPIVILISSILFMRRQRIILVFSVSCLIRFCVTLPLAPGVRFFYYYDCYLIGCLILVLAFTLVYLKYISALKNQLDHKYV